VVCPKAHAGARQQERGRGEVQQQAIAQVWERPSRALLDLGPRLLQLLVLLMWPSEQPVVFHRFVGLGRVCCSGVAAGVGLLSFFFPGLISACVVVCHYARKERLRSRRCFL
jgi:hypothetical protein